MGISIRQTKYGVKFPEVILDPEALEELTLIAVAAGKDEISMWCRVQEIEEGVFFVDTPYIPHQMISAGTVDQDAMGDLDKMDAELEELYGREVADQFTCWVHSHHTLAIKTEPSNTDQNMIDQLANDTGRTMLAARITSKGEIAFDVAYHKGFTFQGIAPEVRDLDNRKADRMAQIKEQVKERTRFRSVYTSTYSSGQVGVQSPHAFQEPTEKQKKNLIKHTDKIIKGFLDGTNMFTLAYSIDVTMNQIRLLARDEGFWIDGNGIAQQFQRKLNERRPITDFQDWEEDVPGGKVSTR